MQMMSTVVRSSALSVLAGILISLHSWAAPPHPDLIFREDPTTGRMMLRDGIRLEDYLPTDAVRATAVLQADGLEYVLVVRVDFSDQPGQRSRDQLDSYFFAPDRVSLQSYYAENSYGQMRIDSGPAGGSLPSANRWYRMPKEMAYYGDGTYNLGRYRELVAEACQAANADVDFSDYDRDGDGFVDHLVLLHSGNDQASTLVYEDIWSLLVTSVNRAYDGVFIDSAVLVAEEPDFPEPHLGIYFHEFFHDLGAPDMYGSNSIADEQDHRWGLMGMFGPYQGENNSGLSPSHICGYLKWDFDGIPENGRYGWIEPVQIESSQELTIPCFERGNGEGRIFRIDLPGKNAREFFLLENRYRESGAMYDTGLPESGIVIWHIDENRPRSAVDVANRLWVEDPSDPLHESAYGDVDSLTAGAAYSLDDGQTAFTPSTAPSSAANDGTPTETSITDIGTEGADMSLRIFFGDTYEPNEGLTQAFAIDQDTIYGSFIYSADDLDYYRFQVQAKNPVVATLDSIPETANYSLRLLDQSGLTVAESAGEVQETRQLVYKPDYTGWMYAQVGSVFGSSRTDSYQISVNSVSTAPGELDFADIAVYPNPLGAGHSKVRFAFTIPGNRVAEKVTLGIYDTSGLLIHEAEFADALGSEVVSWDAVDQRGRRLAPGLYVYVLHGENPQGETQIRGLLAIER